MRPALVQGRNQLRDSFQGEVLRLHGNDERFRRRQNIESQKVKRRRAVQNHQVEIALDRLQSARSRRARSSAAASSRLAPVRFLEPGKSQSISISVGQDDLLRRAVAHQHVIDGVPIVVTLKAKAGRSIGLRITIHEKDLEPLERQARSQINRGRCFSDSALLVDDAENLAHGIQD